MPSVSASTNEEGGGASSTMHDDLQRHFWWTHRSLQDEAVTPTVTAAETVTISIEAIAIAAQARVASWLSASPEPVAQLQAWHASQLATENVNTRVALVERVREVMAWSALLPSLAALRRALVRAWYEQRAEEAQQRIDPLQSSHQAAATVSSSSKAAEVLDDRARRQLESVERQVYEVFLGAVLKGILACVAEMSKRVGDTDRTLGNALVCVSVDALLTDMAGSSGSSSGHGSDWTVGLIRQLETADEPATTTAAPAEMTASRSRHRLHWYICLCLRSLLRWSTSQPSEAAQQKARFPLLIRTARQDVEATVRAMCDRVNGVHATATPHTKSTGDDDDGGVDEDSSAAAADLTAVRGEEKNCATLLHGILDGVSGHGDSALSTHSLHADEGLGMWVSGLRHLVGLTTPADMAWLRDLVVAPLVSACVACRDRCGLSRVRAQLASTTTGTSAVAESRKGGTREDLRAATVRALFLCHRQPATVCLTTTFYDLVAELSEDPHQDAVAGLSVVLQAIDAFWARSSATTRGGEAVTIAVASPSAGESEGTHNNNNNNNNSSLQMNFIYACLARLSTMLAEMDVAVGADAVTAQAPSSTETKVDASASATLAACLAAQPLLTVSRLLTWLVPKGSDLARDGSVDAIVSFKGKSSAARAQAFMEVTDTTNVPSAARVLFPRYCALCDLLEAALTVWQTQSKAHADSASVDPVEVVAQAFVHLVETTLLTRESGQLAVTECVLFATMVLTQSAVEPQWQHVRRVLSRFLCTDRTATSSSTSHDHVSEAVPAQGIWLRIVRRLHVWIVDEHRHGLLLFLLPTFRALGLDWSSRTAESDDQLCLATRFPYSADVAYLYELPKLFCSGWAVPSQTNGVGRHIATHAANDALRWWQDVVVASLDAEKEEEPSVATYVAEMLAEAGLVALARVDVLAAARPRATTTSTQEDPSRAVLTAQEAVLGRTHAIAQKTQTSEVCSAVFLAAMRLSAQVESWSDAQRTAWQTCLANALIRRVALSEGGDTTRAKATLQASAIVQRGLSSAIAPLESVAAADRLVRCLWTAEAEILDDERVFGSIKSLLRGCNLAYMKYIPTKAMLARRAHLEQRFTDMLAARPEHLDAIKHAVREDVKQLLAEEHAQLTEAAQQKRAAEKAEKARKAAEAKEAAAKAAAEEEEARRKAAADAQDSEAKTEPEGDGTTEEKVEVKADEHPKEVVEEKQQEQVEEEEEEEQPVVVAAPKRVRLSASPHYFDALLSAVLARASLSPADATAAALVLCHALEVFGQDRLVEPRDVVRFLLRITEALSVRLAMTTVSEADALAVLFQMIGVHIVLPYKRHFLDEGRRGRARDESGQANEATPAAVRDALYLVDALPDDEKDAFRFLRCFLGDASKAIAQCLTSHHPLGDCAALAVHTRVRSLTGLVQATRDRVEAAVMERVRAVAASAAPLSPALERLRREPWPALPSDLPTPAATVDHLYTRHPPRDERAVRTATSAVASSPTPTAPPRAQPAAETTYSSSRQRRKRSRSRDERTSHRDSAAKTEHGAKRGEADEESEPSRSQARRRNRNQKRSRAGEAVPAPAAEASASSQRRRPRGGRNRTSRSKTH